ncbi:MAG TPA: anti-sigma regulatory factor [Myxococcota bacterium]|nr:anti-sigma regulatory factor [Myxococcota bacterium]
MTILKSDRLPIREEADIVRVRQRTRECALALGFGMVDQTKLVTAASELARNALVHGRGGEVLMESLDEGVRRGVRLTFEDHGPGIADLAQAMRDGYTSGGGMGLGLGGSKRLVNDFEIDSRPGEGTRVCIVRWK